MLCFGTESGTKETLKATASMLINETKEFKALYKEDPALATDYFYKLAVDSNYIRADRVSRDMKWKTPSEYGDIHISINLSKPEKDPNAIALAKNLPQTDFPKCALCHENEAKIYGDIPARCRELLDAFPDLACVYDMGNFVLEGVDPYPEAYRLLKDRIAYFHIKDALAAGAIVPPGCGEAKIAEILAEHKEYIDSDFFVSLEPHLELFSGLNALVGRAFENPYQYTDAKSAFADAVAKLKELI